MYNFKGEKEENEEPYKRMSPNFVWETSKSKIKYIEICRFIFFLLTAKYFQKANYYAYTFNNYIQQFLTKHTRSLNTEQSYLQSNEQFYLVTATMRKRKISDWHVGKVFFIT